MFDDIIEYLSDYLSPERIEQFSQLLNTLSTYGEQDYVDNLNNALAVASDAGSEETIGVIELIILKTVNIQLNSFGVFIHDVDDLERLNYILVGLHTLPNYDDTDAVIQLCEDDDLSPELILSKLLALTCALPWTDFIEFFESVSLSLIERLEELMQEAAAIKAHIPSEDNSRIFQASVRLKRFKLKHDIPLVIDLLARQYSLAMDVEVYLDLYRDDIYSKPIALATAGIISLVLASNTVPSEIAKTVNDIIDQVFDSLNVNAEARKAAFLYLEELNNE